PTPTRSVARVGRALRLPGHRGCLASGLYPRAVAARHPGAGFGCLPSQRLIASQDLEPGGGAGMADRVVFFSVDHVSRPPADASARLEPVIDADLVAATWHRPEWISGPIRFNPGLRPRFAVAMRCAAIRQHPAFGRLRLLAMGGPTRLAGVGGHGRDRHGWLAFHAADAGPSLGAASPRSVNDIAHFLYR